MEGNLKRVTFAQTPIMSSYLLAFVVGEFDYVEEKDSNGVLVRVYTPVGKSNLGQFALDVSRVSPYREQITRVTVHPLFSLLSRLCHFTRNTLVSLTLCQRWISLLSQTLRLVPWRTGDLSLTG